jgi:Na+:H+ antiporter, NhaA family
MARLCLLSERRPGPRPPKNGARGWVRRLRAGASRLAAAARHDQAAGLTLTVACGVALVWANWPHSGYTRVWEGQAPWSSALGLHLSWRDWVNQGLMLGFFALIGMEIRREMVAGELRSWRRASVPVLAALGGMLVPGLVYAVVVAGGPGSHGWGIPVATDVAFALGTLALLGGGGWPRARVFLMTLAVADDIFSVILLVVFYSSRLGAGWLAAGVGALVAMAAVAAGELLVRSRGRDQGTVARWLVGAPASWAQLLLGAVAWWSLLHAGVEAAVVGVAVGALAPRTAGIHHRSGPVAEESRAPVSGTRLWELRLTAVVNVVVLPVFALANTGLSFAGVRLGQAAALRLFLAVLVARVVGKPVGVYLTARLVQPFLHQHLSRRRLAGVGASASVGFTVPLLIIDAALPSEPLHSAAVAGLLAGSVLGAGLAAAVLLPVRSRAKAMVTAGGPVAKP